MLAFGTARRAEARLNLVYGPYLTADSRCSITTARGGACTKLRRRFQRPHRQPPHSKRGKVRDFSRRSRTRLQQTLCAIPIAQVDQGLLFITLTYPREYPGAWQVWKRQLDTFIKRARRKFPRWASVWKLEPQKRGAPHYHLLVVGLTYIAAHWLRRSWTAILRADVPNPGFARVQVERARSHRGVVSYAAKYTAKWQALPDDWQDGVGRWWGVHNREGLGIVWRWVALTEGQFWAATRILRQLIASRTQGRSRAPPRVSSAGSWAVVPDWQALRIAVCVRGTTRIGPPTELREHTGHPGQATDCQRCNRQADWQVGQGVDAAPRSSPSPAAT